VREADYAGIASGKDVEKFAKLNLTPVKGEFVDAPYIKEFPLVIECKLLHTIEIGLHTQFIGEIMDVKAEETVLGEKELPLQERIDQILFSPGTRTYYKVGEFLGKAFSVGKNF
jgi:flavin reductase (DIM6/NTAB) family NADH-FMN oxidoreductase RutF